MKKIFLMMICVISFMAAVQAQDHYKTAAGARISLFSGLTLKHFMKDDKAWEGILAVRWQGVSLSGLYEYNPAVLNSQTLTFVYGFGAHLGYWKVNGFSHPWFPDNGQYVVFGLDGIGGFELRLKDLPFTVSLDWKPMLNLFGHFGIGADDVGLSVRYILK